MVKKVGKVVFLCLAPAILVLVGTALVCSDLLCRLKLLFRGSSPEGATHTSPAAGNPAGRNDASRLVRRPYEPPCNASIVIPNWNGKDLLEKYLPSVIKACRVSDEAQSPPHLVALCSSQPLDPIRPLLYLPSTGNVLREREVHIRLLQQREQELEQLLEERTQWARDLDQRLSEKDGYVLQLQADYDSKVRWALSLQQDVEQARLALQKLQLEFEERTAWALKLEGELKERREDLRLLYGSLWYRIGKNLRLSPIPASDQNQPTAVKPDG